MSEQDRAELDAWWDKNEVQYSSDACHMSEYHMVSVVWEAAVQAERAKTQAAIDAGPQFRLGYVGGKLTWIMKK